MNSFTTEVPAHEIEKLALRPGGKLGAVARDCLKFMETIEVIDKIMIVDSDWDGTDRRQGERRSCQVFV